jgi:hypothetical protein
MRSERRSAAVLTGYAFHELGDDFGDDFGNLFNVVDLGTWFLVHAS